MGAASITRRGWEQSGRDTRGAGASHGAHVGRRGMAGHLHLDSAGAGGALGDAIHGGEAGIIMGSWRRRGPVHLAQLEISIHEQVAQVQALVP